MTLKTKSMIDSLLVEESAKEQLKMVDKIVNSRNKRIRDTVPSQLVIAESGCGFSSYGRAYSMILEDSQIFPVKGSTSFLELVFPKDNPQDEKLFFSSPYRAASIRNRFYGTMLISLEEFDGQDLLKSSSFLALLDFIEMNRSNIHFVFRILPQFAATKQVMAKFSELINIEEIALDTPNLDKGYDYVVRELKSLGYTIDKRAQKSLRDKILTDLVSRNTYAGYKSLNNLVARLNYEVAISNDEDNMVICDEVINRLTMKFEEENASMIEVSKIGFHM